MVSRTARAHPQPYRGPRPAPRRVKPFRGYKVIAAAKFIGTVSRVDIQYGRSAYLVVYLEECGEWVIKLGILAARRLSDMLRPFEEPEPSPPHITYADGGRIRNYLPGKRIWVHWSVQEGEGRLIYSGDVIELVAEENSNA